MKHKSSILGKLDIHQAYTHFKPAIEGAGMVHVIGAKKHGWYSWINNPEMSDAEPIKCLNAIYRHTAAHTINQWIDDDNILHLFHMCCRAAMFINILSIYPATDAYNLGEKDTKLIRNPMSQIFPGLMITLAKYTQITMPNDLATAITTTIFELFDDVPTHVDLTGNAPLSSAEKLVIYIYEYALKQLARKDIETAISEITTMLATTK